MFESEKCWRRFHGGNRFRDEIPSWFYIGLPRSQSRGHLELFRPLRTSDSRSSLRERDAERRSPSTMPRPILRQSFAFVLVHSSHLQRKNIRLFNTIVARDHHHTKVTASFEKELSKWQMTKWILQLLAAHCSKWHDGFDFFFFIFWVFHIIFSRLVSMGWSHACIKSDILFPPPS